MRRLGAAVENLARSSLRCVGDPLLAKNRRNYEARLEEMAKTIFLEMGAPITMTRDQQAAAGLYHINAFIQALENFEFEKKPTPMPSARHGRG